MKYALDTNIITYYLKGHEKIMDKVDNEAAKDNIIIPPLAYFEIKKWLCANNSKIKLQAFEKLFENYGIDIIDKESLDLALSIYIKIGLLSRNYLNKAYSVVFSRRGAKNTESMEFFNYISKSIKEKKSII